ncbi:MAG TPA: undecaprenyl-diphosphate phosphatase [Dictyobacter sp.]|jgi:undecaprenyl-diphosphatase|nr:undecaprenyl-diphosphate phosphatase [Dictyobacter sp.]
MNLFQVWQTIFLGLLQGVSELFPVSSLGQTVIIPSLLGWNKVVSNTACDGQSCFLPIITALHLGTSIALFIYFWSDWIKVIRTLLFTVKTRKIERGTEGWTSWLIIVGTIPTGLIGLALESKLKELFSSPLLTAAFLVVNGSVLLLGEALRRRAEAKFSMLPPSEREKHFRPLHSLNIKEALFVGVTQSLSLIPGFSRSGATMVGGLSVRMTHEDAARFSFLLGAPIILAASLKEVPELFHQNLFPLWLVFLGMIISGVAAFLSTKFMMKYFETGRLTPFAYACWTEGILAVILFMTIRPV